MEMLWMTAAAPALGGCGFRLALCSRPSKRVTLQRTFPVRGSGVPDREIIPSVPFHPFVRDSLLISAKVVEQPTMSNQKSHANKYRRLTTAHRSASWTCSAAAAA